MDNTSGQYTSISDLKHQEASRFVRFIGGIILCLVPFTLSTSTPPSILEQVKEQGFIQMISLNGPSTFYEGRFGYAGFEYELAKAFADELGVELTIRSENSLGAILKKMSTTEGHFAAAGLSMIEERKKNMRFSVPYSSVTQQVIYRRGDQKPRTIDDLIGKKIVVVSKSSHAKQLKRLRKTYPELSWQEKANAEMADLLEMVHQDEADIAIVDSTAYIANGAVYPKARIAFNIAEAESIAWAFPKRQDDSLLKAANVFLQHYVDSGEVKKLEEKYFTRPIIDESNALAFAKRIEERLPKWIDFFKLAAAENQLDWLFIAAMSYQESLWNENAKSFTGVRGLMMLTKKTASDLGVEDRTDPKQSILGGAKYFTQIRKRIPEDIEEPNRTWMALAAYNIGFGHLEDARIITQAQGGDPDIWDDVKARLPLLARKKYYTKTRHGYARGWEPVKYVENIRNYHNILIWHFDNQQPAFLTDDNGDGVIDETKLNIQSIPQL